jgi:hypothetical protein
MAARRGRAASNCGKDAESVRAQRWIEFTDATVYWRELSQPLALQGVLQFHEKLTVGYLDEILCELCRHLAQGAFG